MCPIALYGDHILGRPMNWTAQDSRLLVDHWFQANYDKEEEERVHRDPINPFLFFLVVIGLKPGQCLTFLLLVHRCHLVPLDNVMALSGNCPGRRCELTWCWGCPQTNRCFRSNFTNFCCCCRLLGLILDWGRRGTPVRSGTARKRFCPETFTMAEENKAVAVGEKCLLYKHPINKFQLCWLRQLYVYSSFENHVFIYVSVYTVFFCTNVRIQIMMTISHFYVDNFPCVQPWELRRQPDAFVLQSDHTIEALLALFPTTKLHGFPLMAMNESLSWKKTKNLH